MKIPSSIVVRLVLCAVSASFFVTTAVGQSDPLSEPGWTLVAHMKNSGGMFAGDSNLSPTYTYGTFVETPAASNDDFYRPFLANSSEILFITGNGLYFARGKYAEVLQVVNTRAGDFGANIDFTIAINGVVSATRCKILSRSPPSSFLEDPWISLAATHTPSLTIWGENGYVGDHNAVKNNNGGINVYVNPAVTPTQAPTMVPTVFVTKSYTYYKWEITGRKGSVADGVQAAAFDFLASNGQPVAWSNLNLQHGYPVNPSGSNPPGEAAGNLVDNFINSKWYDNFSFSQSVSGLSVVIFKFTSAQAFGGYQWTTANDVPSRDPSTWTLSGSDDGTSWTILDSVEGFSATDDRYTLQAPWYFLDSSAR